MQTTHYFTNAKGDSLCGVLSNPTGDQQRPLVIILHGFTSNKKSRTCIALQNMFDAHGISSFRFDAYGHGESEEKFEDITITEAVDDILQALSYLKSQGYTTIGLIGISFGGLAGMIAAAKMHDLFALALIAPVSDYEEVERMRKTPEEMSLWKERGFSFATRRNGEKLKLNYTFLTDARENVAYALASKIEIPTLIIHGDADVTVPLSQSQKTAAMIPHCRLVVLTGADHFFNEEAQFEKLKKTLLNFFVPPKQKKTGIRGRSKP